MSRPPSPGAIQHVRPARPLLFPVSHPEWDLGQSVRHLQLCFLIYELLAKAAAGRGAVGSDQFVYFDAADPRRCLAPDGFVKLGVPQDMFETWRVWERGAPELAIEILSPSDTREPIPLGEKLARYASAGVRELVAFDVDAPAGRRVRAWDRLEGELVERVVEGETTPCTTLGLHFVVASANDQPVALRLAADPDGRDLVLTEREEKERAQAEKERAQAEKDAALAEVARLRAELATRPPR